jgi:hypothetical protein
VRVPPAPHATIDFDALAAIDRELDHLIAGGLWSPESYREIRARALAALGGHDPLHVVSFIDLVAEPEWRAEFPTQTPRFQRLPFAVRKVVGRLRRGWQPFIALPAGRALEWNGRPVNTVRVEVRLGPDTSGVVAEVDPAEVDLGNLGSPGIIRDELKAVLAHGWTFRSSNAGLQRQHLGPSATLTFRAYGGVVARSQEQPNLWIIPLDVGHSLPAMGNLLTDCNWYVPDLLETNNAWSGLRLAGRYPYVLVEADRKKNEKPLHALVFQTGGQSIEANSFGQDFFALQFVLGQRIAAGLAFGYGNAGAIAVASPWARSGPRSRNAHPVIGDRWHLAGQWTVEFFECLSSAMRKPTGSNLAGALDMFMQSLDDPLDLAMQDLLLAVASLTSAKEELAPLAHGSRAKELLHGYAVTLPTNVVQSIDQISVTLAARGRLTLDRSSDAALRTMFDLQAELRSVVVALVAVLVGYRGPISGHSATDMPPPWWPATSAEPQAARWSAEGPPQDGTYGLHDDQVLVLVGNPDQIAIVRWLIRAAGLPENRIVVAGAVSSNDLRDHVKRLRLLGNRLIVVADVAHGHAPSASDRLRKVLEIFSEPIIVAPAIPCAEAWLLADDELVAACTDDGETRRQATESLPEEVEDPRSVAQQVFGPPEGWAALPLPDVYRAANRSPSLRHLLEALVQRLGVTTDLPERAVARGLSRDAIAGLIRSLLPDDAVAWRTSDGGSYTAGALAREVEQGTEVGRQYSVDLVSMMINALSRNAKRQRDP